MVVLWYPDPVLFWASSRIRILYIIYAEIVIYYFIMSAFKNKEAGSVCEISRKKEERISFLYNGKIKNAKKLI